MIVLAVVIPMIIIFLLSQFLRAKAHSLVGGQFGTRGPQVTSFESNESYGQACCLYQSIDYVEREMGSISERPYELEKKTTWYHRYPPDSIFWPINVFDSLLLLSRHSTLPELQSFIKLFRSKRIVPDTLDPRLHGLDWTCLDRMFSHCLHPSAQVLPSSASNPQLHLGVTGLDRVTIDAQNDVDVALKNLVGDEAADAAQRWADHGKLLEKFAIVRDYLSNGEHHVVDEGTKPISRALF